LPPIVASTLVPAGAGDSLLLTDPKKRFGGTGGETGVAVGVGVGVKVLVGVGVCVLVGVGV